jgi:hypothetical protein
VEHIKSAGRGGQRESAPVRTGGPVGEQQLFVDARTNEVAMGKFMRLDGLQEEDAVEGRGLGGPKSRDGQAAGCGDSTTHRIEGRRTRLSSKFIAGKLVAGVLKKQLEKADPVREDRSGHAKAEPTTRFWSEGEG